MRDVCEGKTSLFKYIILLSLSSILLIGCKSYKSSHNIFTEDGLIYKDGEELPFTGRILDTLDNQIIEYEVLNGLKNGEFCLTSANGTVAVYGSIKNNMNVGKWRYFYSSGRLESEGGFIDDKPNGKWIWYFENGNIKENGYFIEGYKIGRWCKYTQSGILTSAITYNNGEIINEVNYSKVKML